MTEKSKRECLEELRQWFKKWTDCTLQHGWPCGTCCTWFLSGLGVSEDGEHNTPVDRVNEVWRGILQMREHNLRDDDEEEDG